MATQDLNTLQEVNDDNSLDSDSAEDRLVFDYGMPLSNTLLHFPQ